MTKDKKSKGAKKMILPSYVKTLSLKEFIEHEKRRMGDSEFKKTVELYKNYYKTASDYATYEIMYVDLYQCHQIEMQDKICKANNKNLPLNTDAMYYVGLKLLIGQVPNYPGKNKINGLNKDKILMGFSDVEQNLEEAIYYLSMASENGNINATLLLIDIYEKGYEGFDGKEIQADSKMATKIKERCRVQLEAHDKGMKEEIKNGIDDVFGKLKKYIDYC